jgi:hypothetical protein
MPLFQPERTRGAEKPAECWGYGEGHAGLCCQQNSRSELGQKRCGSPLSTLLEVSLGLGVMAGAHFVPWYCTKRTQTIIMV